jgi:hypothetical protein
MRGKACAGETKYGAKASAMTEEKASNGGGNKNNRHCRGGDILYTL